MKRRNALILALTSFIWGISFVAQSEGGDAIGPYSFNCIRSFIGALFLVVIITITDKVGLTKKPENKIATKDLIKGGTFCGIVLCIATNLQQMGIYLGTPSGKAGFLTACYILLVPILGIFLKRKCGLNVWLAVLITLIGLYLLCINGDFYIQLSDLLVMICAFCFSIHIMVIDHFSPKVDGLRMSCIQFLVTGILTSIPMLFVDINHSDSISSWLSGFTTWDAWIPLLYAGIFSCGIAYTLQIIGQKGVNPTIASLIMSLESVFSVLAGWLLLKEKLTKKELTGCLFIFIAVILAQLPTKTDKQ
ncbi:MAG: DMT family transporter [Lachnospiraceae bacterium]|nr:DMT family transporter [Lachnospiraceae bacterium]